jgi:L,D-transpeptidase YcbB
MSIRAVNPVLFSGLRHAASWLAMMLSVVGWTVVLAGPGTAQEVTPDAWQAETHVTVVDPQRASLLALLDKPQSVPLPVRQKLGALRAYYGDPASQDLWHDDKLAAAFIHRLENAHKDGLGPRDNLIEQLRAVRRINRLALTQEAQLQQSAMAELYWSAGFLKYAAQLKKGRFLPTKIDSKLFWQPKEIDMVAALQLVSTLGDVDAFFNAWEPQLPTYKALKKALAEYQSIEAAGGWPRVKVIEVLKPGEDNDIVPQLRARLAVTDGAPNSPPPGQETIYGEDLQEAVKRFQRRHGLEDDGVVGKNTFFQLNIPVQSRLRQVVLSMERLRWMPEDLGKHYILVNIAGYDLRRVQNSKVQEVMRVVVGKPYHQTPVFSETMKYVEVNPYWNVPRSIAVSEELPKLKRSPGARAAKGFEAVVNNKPIPLTAINWSQYSRTNFPMRLRQKPGPNNALGRVKFMFPNRFNVYMHDTPARSLFSKSARAFSHGCIRLARPIDMTEQVLSTSVPGWDRKRVDSVVESKKRTVVSLKSPIEVHITYSTSWRDEDGDVQFRPDIYRRDAKLYAALFGKPYPY